MEVARELLLNRVNYFRSTMASIETPNTPAEIEQSIAVDVFNRCSFAAAHVDWDQLGHSSWHSLIATPQ